MLLLPSWSPPMGCWQVQPPSKLGKGPLSLSFGRMSTFTPAFITKGLPSGILPRMKEISEVTSCRFIGEKADIQIGAPLAFKEILSHQAHL